MAKKIGAIASLSIIGILIILTIILANIKINYSVKCETPTSVWVNYSNSTYSKVNEEQANKIVNYINNASKENSLTALFTGNLDKKAELTAVSGSKTLPSYSGFYVEYSYSTPQKLMDGKKEYKTNGNTVNFERLVYSINDANDVTEIKVYVYTSTTAEYYSYYYTVEGNFNNLYNYLVECGLNK